MKYFKLLIFNLFFVFIFNVNALYKEEVKLSKCVDGDTARFIYNDEEIKARFLAIDTPETVHPTKEVEAYGKNASEYTCTLLTNAKVIEIEYDNGSDKKDKYDRDLVWVFVDGELLQEKLVSVGYASVKYIYGDYLYTDKLYEVEEEAKKNKLGIWSEESNVDNETTSKEDTKEQEEGTTKFSINGVDIEINNTHKIIITTLIVLSIILAITKSKIKIKKKN